MLYLKSSAEFLKCKCSAVSLKQLRALAMRVKCCAPTGCQGNLPSFSSWPAGLVSSPMSHWEAASGLLQLWVPVYWPLYMVLIISPHNNLNKEEWKLQFKFICFIGVSIYHMIVAVLFKLTRSHISTPHIHTSFIHQTDIFINLESTLHMSEIIRFCRELKILFSPAIIFSVVIF